MTQVVSGRNGLLVAHAKPIELSLIPERALYERRLPFFVARCIGFAKMVGRHATTNRRRPFCI